MPGAFLSRCTRLRSVLASALKVGIGKQEQDPYTRFHEQFRKEADEYDRDFHKKYQDDLNAALVFVSRSPFVSFPLPNRDQGRSLLCRSVGIHRSDPTAAAT